MLASSSGILFLECLHRHQVGTTHVYVMWHGWMRQLDVLYIRGHGQGWGPFSTTSPEPQTPRRASHATNADKTPQTERKSKTIPHRITNPTPCFARPKRDKRTPTKIKNVVKNVDDFALTFLRRVSIPKSLDPPKRWTPEFKLIEWF